MSPAPDLRAALPGYEVGRELGRGSMGEVLAGRHLNLDRQVAIKRLPEAFASDDEVRRRFGDEARMLASLTHPHIVPVYDYVEQEGLCLLVMQALPGGTVRERFSTVGLSMPSSCAIVIAACAGLQHAHDHQVLHRDVKPDNLLFDDENRLKVVDFGIAAVVSGEETLATLDGEIVGTPAYMAPEQAAGEQAGPGSDVYAAATMLYELLAGRLPFSEDGDSFDLLRRRLDQEPEPLDLVAPSVPPALVPVTMTGLSRRPEDRYRSAMAFGEAIGAAATGVWGRDWLEQSEIPIMDPAAVAAATPAGEPPLTATGPNGAPPGVSQGDDRRAGPTIGPDRTERPTQARVHRDAPTIAPGAPRPTPPTEDRSRSTVATGATNRPPPTDEPTPPAPGSELERRRPERERPHGDGMAFEHLDPDELVRVKDVLSPPPPPFAAALGAAGLMILAALVCIVGFGSPSPEGRSAEPGRITVAGTDLADDDSLAADLSEPVTVGVADVPGATRAELDLSAVGVRYSTASAQLVPGEGVASAQLDVGPGRFVSSGPVSAEIRLLDEQAGVVVVQEFELDPGQPPYLSLTGAFTVLLALVLVGYFGTLSRPLRRGRRSRSSSAGLVVVGAVAGVSVTAACWTLGAPEPGPLTWVVAAGLGAGSGAATAIALFRAGRRRRLRRRERAQRLIGAD